ncbi:hypothetical protein [aff. Roholtiella sp. LEGE 12411]|uniref:hypothetical protein n=1 Tax=aff. Roholtiella sp. LEGE 12411 TaxID=1828822 RepID=UPI0018821D34|nr:hypothetical protein [aff. Roholtiella sp. LEGE 12411]MBE9035775.1 hypothetical protein [aff. Roholtiella sp. LEGE 12411]
MNVDILKKIVPKPLIMFGYSLVFLLALISTAGLINTVLPSSGTPQNLDDISVKFQYFTEHKDDYNVIFLGPSTTYQGVTPKVFDETMAENDKKIRSFNFGILAANVAEMDFYLQKILALKPAKLKWIFLDCLDNIYMEEAPNSAKNVYWHTPIKTIENFKLIAESTYSFKDKISGYYANSISFLHRWLGIGYFSNYWQPKLDPLSKRITGEKLLQEAGYYAMDWLKNSEEWKKTFQLNYLQSYKIRLKQAKLGVLDRENTSVYPLDSYALKIIKKMIYRIDSQEEINKIKVEPIFFIPPILDSDGDHSAIMRAYDLGHISTILAFNNPNTFATLYDIERRADARHLNHQGAQEFTRALAAKFSEHLKLSQKEIYNQQPISISQN